MSNVDVVQLDFGLIDFLMQKMTFTSQDCLRLLIEKVGDLNPFYIELDKGIAGLLKSLEAFSDSCQVTTNDYRELVVSIKSTMLEIKKICLDHSINQEITWPKLKNGASESVNWDILQSCSDYQDKETSLVYVGAYFSSLLFGGSVPKYLQGIVKKIVNDGEDTLNLKAQKALAILLLKSQQTFGDREKSFAERVRSFHFSKKYFSSDKERQSALNWKCLTYSEYFKLAEEMFQGVKNGDQSSLLDSLSLICGLPTNLISDLPILDASTEDWIYVVDINRGIVLFDLAQIFPNGAKPKSSHQSYEPASSILVKPLPIFVKEFLLELQTKIPNARKISDLLEIKTNTENKANKINRLINSTVVLATQQCKVDPFYAALLGCDFRKIASGKSYYRQTNRQTIWETSNQFFEAIGWGSPVDFVDGLAYGSQVVVKHASIENLFNYLSHEVNDTRPSNRANINSLLNFHDKFCNFTATFSIFCLALRNSNPIPIASCDFRESNAYILIDDKHVLGVASKMPVAICDSLMLQLTYWRLHCEVLLRRLVKIDYLDKKFIGLLQSILDYKKVPLFITSNSSYKISVSAVSKSWNQALVENFARHFWETNFIGKGVSSRFSAAQLRHQTSGTLSWASDSDFALREFIYAISIAQEVVLRELNMRPIHGLARR